MNLHLVRSVAVAAVLSCASALALAQAPAAPATPAQAKVAEIEKALADAQAAAETSQTRVASLTAELAKAKESLADDRIDRARTGDPAALREFLDSLDDGLPSVAFRASRVASGPGVDAAKFVAAVADRWARCGASAKDARLKAKMCWLLGRNATPAAAAQLRAVLASDQDPFVLANAAFALSVCPRSPEDVPALQRLAVDKCAFAFVFGDLPRSPVLGDYVGDILARRQAKDLATVPGELTSYTTFVSAGFEWRIAGDANLNCAVKVVYRKKGDADWRPAQPLLRVEPGIFNHYEQDAGNLLAGSVFFLAPGTTYDVRLTLEDPDGGKDERTVSVTTRTEPEAAADAPVYYVSPGDPSAPLGAGGGGTGTKDDPFLGFAAAVAKAKPGDLFLINPGTYKGAVNLAKDGEPGKPIVWRGVDAAKVIIDGGVERIVNINGRKHVFLERLTIINGRYAVNAMNTTGCVVRRCIIKPSEGGAKGYVGILAQGKTSDLVVSDNFIQVGVPWEIRKRDGWGLVAPGAGNVICYNHITDSWDGLTLQSDDRSAPTRNIDIYGNLFERCTDDGIEADSVRQNVRVFRNRIVNCGSGLSSQPCFGGPEYFLFNDIFNCRIKPFKYHVGSIGIISCHNTSICSRQGWSGGDWRDVKHRNNLILGNLEPTASPEGVNADLDYDGYNRAGPELFRLNRVSFRDLDELASVGIEKHGIMVSLDDFVKAVAPHHPEWTYKDGYGAPYAASDVDLRLKPDSKAVDAGEVLPNINDGFAGKAPDLGCYELGQPLPPYGPRPEK